MRAFAAGAPAVVLRDVRQFRSYRLRPLSLLMAPVATVTLFYYVSRLVSVPSLGSSDGYFAYVVVGTVALEVITSTIATAPISLRQELVAGTFERIVISPFGAVRTLAAMLVFPLMQSALIGTATLVFAGTVFGMPVAWPGVLLAIPLGVLAAFAFAPFGMLTCAAILVFKQSLSVVPILLTGLSIFAGVYFPVALLPDKLRWVSDVQPLTPALSLLRGAISPLAQSAHPWLDIVKLVGFAVVLVPAALWLLERSVDAARRRGTIIEY